MQKVTLNEEMQRTLQIKETEMSFSHWIRSFRHTAQHRLQRALHQLLTEGLQEESVQLMDKNSSRKYQCKMMHLTNGQIAFSLKGRGEESTCSESSPLSSDQEKNKPLPLNEPISNHSSRRMTHLSHAESTQLKTRMGHLVDKFPHGLALINHDWELTYANPKMEEVTGFSFLKNYFKKLWDIFPVNEHYNFFQQYLRAMETQETVEFEGFIPNTDTNVQVTVHPTEIGITVFVQDITIYKRHLQALKESEERFALLANNIKDVFWISQPDFKELHYVSPSFQKMFGISRREAFLNPEILMRHVYKADQSALQEAFDQMSVKENEVEYRIKDSENRMKWIRTKGFPVEYNGHSYVLGIHEDVTEYKEMLELKEKSQQLSTITQMSAGIAHEIKNPLTAIKGFLQIGAANPELRDNYQEIILDEVNRIEAIVQDFMMLSKPKSSIQLEQVDPEQLVSYVLRLLEPEANEKQIYLLLECDTIQDNIETEPKRLNQILINLVKNAIDAVDLGGEVRVIIRMSTQELTLSVKDNGPGLTPQELAKIGEPFFTTKEKGTGLGVMVTKKIISDLNGKITYESQKGRGTTVTVTLPK
ncbi:two-component system, sporulation sensor kinase A [Halobacillus dabanensis]|uniref:histidine kinase n=1 Tax=Halobacillus dabanensis TaxID=240302 RepID=A0A1I3XQU2_HALDA|nr:PAS domain-containing sensor histidine kinase [Halobacillus dabanensis]SFK21853.1 two-component system, sporulation sensor kinase A [Halobacillus dabanensis]